MNHLNSKNVKNAKKRSQNYNNRFKLNEKSKQIVKRQNNGNDSSQVNGDMKRPIQSSLGF